MGPPVDKKGSLHPRYPPPYLIYKSHQGNFFPLGGPTLWVVAPPGAPPFMWVEAYLFGKEGGIARGKKLPTPPGAPPFMWVEAYLFGKEGGIARGKKLPTPGYL
jgi:hypothetical protein